MTGHPDILRRFIPAVYVFDVIADHRDIRVESNHLDIAFSLRRYVRDCAWRDTRVSRWRVIRDESIRGRLEEILVLDSGPLKILFVGPGTILIHDSERYELFGFLAAGLDLKEIIDSVLPLLFKTA